MRIAVDRSGWLAAFDDRPDNAAHSMDTDWYAVDRQGHVARMWSDEEGAVPWDAHRQYWDELFDDLGLARIETLASTTAPGRVLTLAPDVQALDPGGLPFQWDGVLRFADRDMLELFHAEHWHPQWRVLDGMPFTVSAKDILKPAFDDYWAAGAIVGAYVLGRPVRPRALGLFEYACTFSGPYRRAAVPPDPMHIDSLPASLRAKLGSLRLPKIGFDTTTEFDPERFLRCQTYR